MLSQVFIHFRKVFYFFYFLLFRATPVAYGGSQAKCQIGAVAGSLTHRARPGIVPTTSWLLVGFISAVPRRELLCVCVCELQCLVLSIGLLPFPLLSASHVLLNPIYLFLFLLFKIFLHLGVPVAAQWVKNSASIHEDVGSIRPRSVG